MSFEELAIAIVLVVLGAGLGNYVSSRFLHWAVPRREGLIPNLVTALIGSALVGWGGMVFLGSQFDIMKIDKLTGVLYIVPILLGFIGTVLALYAAVKIGTPGHATVTVVCNGFGVPNDGGQRKTETREDRIKEWAKGRGIDFEKDEPTVWPKRLWVSQEGSVSWILYGEPRTKVTIEFKKGDDIFATKGDSESVFKGYIPDPPAPPEASDPSDPSSSWHAQAPGLIVAGPVVRAGHGKYSIIVTDSLGTRIIDPDWDSPRKKG